MTEPGPARPAADEHPVPGSGSAPQPGPFDEELPEQDGESRDRRGRSRWSRIARPEVRLPGIVSKRSVIRSIRVGVVAVAASVVLGVAAFAAVTVYAQYGAVRNVPNAEAWRGLTQRYAGQAACTACHPTEAGQQDASAHIDVSCEGCHGPAALHASSTPTARTTALAKPDSGICITCHGIAAGRPADFPQVDSATHYSGGECLRCHSPHSITAVRPPIVTHPLASLPDCTACHAPDGLKEVPSGHELVADAVCLSCHGRAAAGK